MLKPYVVIRNFLPFHIIFVVSNAVDNDIRGLCPFFLFRPFKQVVAHLQEQSLHPALIIGLLPLDWTCVWFGKQVISHLEELFFRLSVVKLYIRLLL